MSKKALCLIFYFFAKNIQKYYHKLLTFYESYLNYCSINNF